MTLRIFSVLVGLVALLSGVAMLGEHSTASPGPISEAHAELAVGCRACHTPFEPVSAGCEACHGELPEANVHAESEVACGSCHVEHGGSEASLITPAREGCEGCHEHASVLAVEAHAIGGSMSRLIDAADPARERVAALTTFSHALHREEDDSLDCQDCHYPGEGAEAAILGTDLTEQLVRWSGCSDCHDDWQEAGFPALREGYPMVPLVLQRMPRILYSHSTEHLKNDCEQCHVAVGGAAEVPFERGPETGHADAEEIASCFQCHGEQATQQNSAQALGACSDCHSFHGEPHETDFPDGAQDTPQQAEAGVLARAGGLAFTPWLGFFVLLSGAGFAAAWRRLPAAGGDDDGGGSDAPAGRVSEVPVLSASFETSVPGIYIIGELAGVPLVNRAMKSGFDAIDFIANKLQVEGREAAEAGDVVDVLIAGSGPAGLGAATRAKHLGLSYTVVEKSTPAATIRNYPRAKVIQAAPIDIPDYGSFFQEDDESKEALVRRWEDIIARTGVVIREREEVVGVAAHSEVGITVTTSTGDEHLARTVVLALGMRGTPRRLGLDGETNERAEYLLIDAAEHEDRDILVVGGGNAAIEAALDLCNPKLMNRVTVSCFEPVLTYVTAENSKRVDEAVGDDRIDLICGSTVREIREGSVVLNTPAGEREVKNEHIFVMIGAELPIPFLKGIGIKLIRKGGI